MLKNQTESISEQTKIKPAQFKASNMTIYNHRNTIAPISSASSSAEISLRAANNLLNDKIRNTLARLIGDEIRKRYSKAAFISR